MPETPIKHYRKIEAGWPFTLSQLETFCTTLRAQGIAGDASIYCNYQVTLSVSIPEPLLTPAQLKAI